MAATKRLGEVTFLNCIFFFFFNFLGFLSPDKSKHEMAQTTQIPDTNRTVIAFVGLFLCLYNQLLVCLGISLSNQTVFVSILFLYLNISSGFLRLLRLNRHITHINNKINIQPYQSISFILNK